MGSCEHNNTPSGFIKVEKFLRLLSGHQSMKIHNAA